MDAAVRGRYKASVPRSPDGPAGDPLDRPLVEFQEEHRELDRLFAEHQAAVISLDLDRARERLEAFRDALHRHAAAEEELVFPVYEPFAGDVVGGGLELVLAEHDKLRRLLDGLFDELAALSARGAPGPGDVIELLDREFTFKHLLQHHDQRETNAVYPTLDRELTDAERRELWRGLAHYGRLAP